jgi:hypothetical protein
MSPQRTPASCSWGSIFAVPVLSFLIVLVILHLLTPRAAGAQTRQLHAAAEVSSNGPYEHGTMAPDIVAHPLRGVVEIDGVLSEDVWGSVQPFTGFIQRDPDEGRPVSERTEVRILVGPDALYVGARLFDSDPAQIRATLVRRDVFSDFDYFMVNLDSRHDHNTSYAFTLTPSGAYQDAALGADGEYDFGWDPVWEGGASVDEGGWSAEFRIPFSQLRFESAEDAIWGIQLTRVIARKQELSAFAFTPKTETSGPHRYGHLRGLGSVLEPKRLELLPYATTRSEHLSVHPDDPFRSEADRFYGAGMDVKYGLTGSLTLDATINPDFGQVEVDPAVVNLTQYETFFPERRPFFVEGSEIFRYGFPGVQLNQPDIGTLFYSRRIGRAPQRNLRGSGVSFVDSPEKSTIGGAMKISGRIGENWSLGLMEAATLQEKGQYSTVGGAKQTEVVEPFSNYLVGRARRDLRDGNSTLGAIVTAVNRDLTEEVLGEFLHSSAYVAGLDFNHSWKNREWVVNGTLTGSRVQGSEEAILRTQRSSARYWQRPDAGHVTLDPARTSLDGWRGSLNVGRQSGDHWLGSVLFQAQSPGFEANDLGFETRVDSWDGNLFLQYRDVEPDDLTRSYQIDFMTAFERNFDGDLLGLNVFLGSVQSWSNYWMSSTAISAYPERDDDRMTRGGPMARAPSGFSVAQWIATDQRKPYTAEMQFRYAENGRGGWGVFPQLGVTFRPASAMEVGLSPTYQRTSAVAQYVAAVPDETADRTYGTRYVFSDLDQTILSLDTRVSWTFTPRLSLQLYMQPFLASGDYSRFKELHEPRKWGWDVYGDEVGTLSEVSNGYEVDPDGTGPADSFTLQNPDFNVRSLRGNAVLRWEYRPGSTLYFVWQQRRFRDESFGEFKFREDLDALWNIPPENVFALKVSYWWGR